MTRLTIFGWSALALACGAASVAAQGAPGAIGAPCRAVSCSLVFDWGNGAAGASLPNDRRYGAPAEFEATVKQTLRDSGFKVLDSEGGDAKLAITVRLRQVSAMCDFMPGTNTNKSCQAIRDAAVTFVGSDPAVKKPNSMNLANRCNASDQAMTNPQFGRYVAAQLQYAFEGEEKHLSKPTGRC